MGACRAQERQEKKMNENEQINNYEPVLRSSGSAVKTRTEERNLDSDPPQLLIICTISI